MKIAILTTAFFHDAKEVTRIINGERVKGNDRIVYGGAERYTVDLCHLLQEEGHTVTVFQPFPGIQQSFTKEYKGICFVMIPNNGGWEYNGCADLNWQFNENAALYDLRIYMATFLAFPNAISPCIAISHGVYWDNTQGNNTLQAMDEAKRKEFMRRQLYGFTGPDVVVSVDSNVRKVIHAIDPGSERKIQIIYNYVDCEKFYPGKKTWEETNILFPRRLTVLRGSTEVTKAFMNMPNYNFTIAGQAHDNATAQAFFKSHEHRKHVQFIHREMDDMPEVYRQADISLVPTISTEGLSLSLLESMASGLPIITTPVGGLGDAVINGYNGLIYDPNHEDICDYITALAEDKEVCERFGKRNREIAVECFDKEIWKARWKALLVQFGIVPEKQYHIDYGSGPDYTAIKDGRTGKTVQTVSEQWDYLQKEIPTDRRKEYTDSICKAYSKQKEPEDNGSCLYHELEKHHSKKPKLVAMMLTHNEAGRYLERVIENTLLFCDEIVIRDDHSTDSTNDKIADFVKLYPGRIKHVTAICSWDNESALRKELLNTALELSNPDWLIAIDADELYEADRMKEQLPYLMSQKDADWIAFRFYDMWNDEQHYRDDDIWPAGNSYAPRMFRVKTGEKYAFANTRRHCGSIPVNVLQSSGMNSNIRVKHLGWMKPDDRDKKYLDRITDDPGNEYFSQEVYDAILDEHPKLVKWDDNNLWQTGKLTIAYPPGMEWNIMQQRPHHLLKLAASERHRVFFGDDSAIGIYEPLPYLTVVNGKVFDCYNSVDVLYITDPRQMESCKKIEYKKLIYDCCDWQNNLDNALIALADIVLCASKQLFNRLSLIECANGSIPKKAIYLPNACEYGHFSAADNPQFDNVVGYMGCIHPVMIDKAIIKAIAEEFKVMMIGQNKGMEFNHKNIYTTGHVPYHALPGLLSQCSVAIIPFQTDNDYLRYSAPIKVYEYLSAGRPVVASPIPELLPLAEEGLIRIVDNNDLNGWVKAVKEAMTEYPNIKGQEWAKEQTWKARWETLKKECLES